MTMNDIYKIAFRTISDSTEWGLEYDNPKEYAQFVDGICAMTNNIILELEKKEIEGKTTTNLKGLS